MNLRTQSGTSRLARLARLAVFAPLALAKPALAQSDGAPPVAAEPSSSMTVVELSAVEVVERALRDNPTLRTFEIDLRRSHEQIRAEEDRYPYSLLADAGVTRSESTQLRVDDSVASSSSRSLDASVGVRRIFPAGTVAEVRASEQYFDRDISATTVSPFLPADSGHAATLRASVAQPFLRGYGAKLGEVELRAARSNRALAESALRRSRSALARDVLLAYYDLWYAEQALAIERASLELAREQQSQAEQRLEVGALSAAEMLSFQTRTSELEEGVIAAELTSDQRSLTLAQLMGSYDAAAPRFRALDAPELGAAIHRDAALRDALSSSSVELAELEGRIRLAQLRAEVAGDSSRPRLDADAYVQSTGLSQQVGDAWGRAAGFEWWSAHVGLSLELPLTSTRHEAQRAQAQYDVLTTRSQLQSTKNLILMEVNGAVASEQAARQRLESAERTLGIAQRAYEAAAARFELGQTIAISLHLAEDDLRRAQLRVVRARVDAQQQRLRLEHLVGRLPSRAQSSAINAAR